MDEGAVETAQQTLDYLKANSCLGYDPKRDTFDGVRESDEAAAGMSDLYGALLTILGAPLSAHFSFAFSS